MPENHVIIDTKALYEGGIPVDGYIKNKKAEIRANHQVIACCYLITLPIVITEQTEDNLL